MTWTRACISSLPANTVVWTPPKLTPHAANDRLEFGQREKGCRSLRDGLSTPPRSAVRLNYSVSITAVELRMMRLSPWAASSSM